MMFLTPFPVYRSVWGVSNPMFSNAPCSCPLLIWSNRCFIPTPSHRKKRLNQSIIKSQKSKIGHFRSPGVTSGDMTYSNKYLTVLPILVHTTCGALNPLLLQVIWEKPPPEGRNSPKVTNRKYHFRHGGWRYPNQTLSNILPQQSSTITWSTLGALRPTQRELQTTEGPKTAIFPGPGVTFDS